MNPSTTPDPAAEGFEVRPARPKDARSFFEMWSAVVAEGRFVRPDETRRPVRFYKRTFKRSWSPDRADLVAVGGRRVVGHLTVVREDSSVCRHVASLGIAVGERWRGRGVGSALMQEAIRWARQMGVEKLALSVYPDNAAAREMYRRFGFVEEGCLTGHSKKAIGYRDEILMGLWLVPRPEAPSSSAAPRTDPGLGS
jgi:RimJ/RimL family protein N-acetyltransferase